MSTKNKKAKKIIIANGGMTLVELLVAISLLTLIIFCFMPLFMSYYQNIRTSGNVVKGNYTKVGLIEKLIGNTGSNSGYEYEVDGIPLSMSVKEQNGGTIQVKSKITETETGNEYGQKITGNNIISTPDATGGGFTTFYADSVTSKLLCFPSHISDDFKEKTITVFASGFKFNNINEMTLQYSGEDGNFHDVSKNYYKVSQPVNNPGIVYLTLYGDNSQINFRTSPLKIKYPGKSDLIVEIDAPTIIMVGEQTNNGDYYYYVSSGDINDDGTMDIVAKTMNNTDKDSKTTVTLNSAMNDVEWIDADEGDGENVDADGKRYGYYAMCGDNGQIRRFWKDASGKYYWGGDNTIHYDYSSVQPERVHNDHVAPVVNETKKPVYSTEASYKYLFVAYPYAGDDVYNGDRTDGISLDSYIEDSSRRNRLYTNTAFTFNAVDNENARFWAIKDNLLYTFEHPNNNGSWGQDKKMDGVMFDRYVNDTKRTFIGSYDEEHGLALFEGYGNAGGSVEKIDRVSSDTKNGFDDFFKVNRVNASEVQDYEDFWGENYSDGIVLTSVDTVKMNNTYTADNGNPTSSYTLYCGYIPAVVDLWSPTKTLDSPTNEFKFTRWIATLGVGYVEDSATLLSNYPLFRSRRLGGSSYLRLGANIWEYSNSKNSSYALTGICGPANYASSESLSNALALLEKQKNNPSKYGIKQNFRTYPVYPLNTDIYQSQMQKQNTTQISIGYLSNPRAMGSLYNEGNAKDLSPDVNNHEHVYQWTFNPGTTFLDSDSITIEDEEGNPRSMSIAVGYTLNGLENGFDNGVIVPTVMNSGVVYLRSGGANNDRVNSGGDLSQESNIFHMYYYTSDYWEWMDGASGTWGIKKVFDGTASAGYWRDAYHPLYYSTYGQVYDPVNHPSSYIFAHILNDKQLTCVAWGNRWDSQPEAMWGASDGTLMNWGDTLTGTETNNSRQANTESAVKCEFQSYKWLDVGSAQKKTYIGWRNWGGDKKWKWFDFPNSLAQNFEWIKENGNNISVENGYFDCRSLILWEANRDKNPEAYGFISPLDTIEDVAYSDDTWVAVGCQGQKNPIYCGTMAVTRSSGSGSWVAVRTWHDLSGGADSQPCSGSTSANGKDNNFFLWHAVQISTTENCNIVQVTNTGGMWYAVGYIDENDNNECDSDEKAVVFYAEDPSKACGTEGGWRLAKSSVSSSSTAYTQACHYNGNSWETVDISSINSMASRND